MPDHPTSYIPFRAPGRTRSGCRKTQLADHFFLPSSLLLKIEVVLYNLRHRFEAILATPYYLVLREPQLP